MVKITTANKRKGKISPTLILAVVATLAIIGYYATQQQDDSSLGSLLNVDLQSVSSEAVYNVVSESVSSVVGNGGSSSILPAPVERVAVTNNVIINDATGAASSKNYVASSTSGLQPLRCQELFEEGYRQAGQSKAVDEELNPNNDQVHARFTKNFTSKFWVSVHHDTFDSVQYKGIMDLGMYNKQAFSNAALKIVQQATAAGSSNTPRVLDVGAQVGWFSLLARGLGVEVDAFEPLRPNLFRLCESLHLNRWSNFVEHKYPGPFVNVYGLALSNLEEEELSMKQTGASASLVDGEKSITVKATTLDAFTQSRGWTNEQNICLLKINTMGMENKVLAGATSLLASKMVKNVLIGIVMSSSDSGTEAINTLLSANYKLYQWGNANGPDQDAESLPKDASSLMESLKSKAVDDEQVFLWFTL